MNLFATVILGMLPSADMDANCTQRLANVRDTFTVYETLECIGQHEKTTRFQLIQELDEKLLARWKSGEVESYEFEATALSELIDAHQSLGDLKGRDYMVSEFINSMQSHEADAWAQAKSKSFIAYSWLQLGEEDKLAEVLEDMIHLVEKMPLGSVITGNPRNQIVTTILDLQGKAGFIDWREKTKAKFDS